MDKRPLRSGSRPQAGEAESISGRGAAVLRHARFQEALAEYRVGREATPPGLGERLRVNLARAIADSRGWRPLPLPWVTRSASGGYEVTRQAAAADDDARVVSVPFGEEVVEVRLLLRPIDAGSGGRIRVEWEADEVPETTEWELVLFDAGEVPVGTCVLGTGRRGDVILGAADLGADPLDSTRSFQLVTRS